MGAEFMDYLITILLCTGHPAFYGEKIIFPIVINDCDMREIAQIVTKREDFGLGFVFCFNNNYKISTRN